MHVSLKEVDGESIALQPDVALTSAIPSAKRKAFVYQLQRGPLLQHVHPCILSVKSGKRDAE